jgi:hypothetical protein
MLKFSVQTFYQPLFNNSFPFSNLFPSKSFLHQKGETPRQKPHIPKQKPKAKGPSSSFKGSFIPSGKQGGAVVLGEGRDIVIIESSVIFLFCEQG